LKADEEKLKDENDKLKADEEKLKDENDKLKRDKKELEDENDKLKRDKEELEDDNEQLIREHAKLKELKILQSDCTENQNKKEREDVASNMEEENKLKSEPLRSEENFECKQPSQIDNMSVAKKQEFQDDQKKGNSSAFAYLTKKKWPVLNGSSSDESQSAIGSSDNQVESSHSERGEEQSEGKEKGKGSEGKGSEGKGSEGEGEGEQGN